MQTLTVIILLAGGILCLYMGAELLVMAASKLARSFGMTSLMTGLTIVSFCTSTPELASSLMAQIEGPYPDVALGNVIGTNIANIGLILGALALIKPMPILKSVKTFEAPLCIGAAGLLWLVMLSHRISRGVGILFCVLLVFYIIRHAWAVKKEKPKEEDEKVELSLSKRLLCILLIITGSAILAFGGYIEVLGAVKLGAMLGLSDRIMGLLVVAFGTSLPEFAATSVALLRKMPDVALGNMFGSNVYNILMVLGVVSIVKPINFSPKFITQDMPILMIFSFLIWGLIAFRDKIGRFKGGILLVCYVGYVFFILR